MQSINPYKLAHCLDDESKLFWGCSFALNGLAAFLGAVTLFLPEYSISMGFISVILLLTSFCFDMMFDLSRSKSQEFRRKLDLQDGLGQLIPPHEVVDTFAKCQKFTKRRIRTDSSDSKYFGSQELPGPRRLLQNIRESAWWSNRLARLMRNTLIVIIVFTIVSALACSISALASANLISSKHLQLYPIIAQFVCAILTSLVSLNLIKLAFAYHSFAASSHKCFLAADGLLARPSIQKYQAISVAYEYFIERGTSPVLPTWLWKLHREELNAIFPAI